MVRDAEAHAEEDKKFRELAETRNRADGAGPCCREVAEGPRRQGVASEDRAACRSRPLSDLKAVLRGDDKDIIGEEGGSPGRRPRRKSRSRRTPARLDARTGAEGAGEAAAPAVPRLAARKKCSMPSSKRSTRTRTARADPAAIRRSPRWPRMAMMHGGCELDRRGVCITPRRFCVRNRLPDTTSRSGMAKRDYYQVLELSSVCHGGRDQEGVSPPGDEAASRSQSWRSRDRGEVQGGQGGLRSPLRRAEARGLRPVWARRRRCGFARRPGWAGLRSTRRVRRHFRRRVRRHLRWLAVAAAALRYSAGRTSATNSNSTSSRRCLATPSIVDFATLGECEDCKGSGSAKGAKPVTCETCHGQGQVRMQQGFFTVQQTCPRVARAAARS